MSKNEKGQSWPEALLSLLIVMVIFGSLLPVATVLTASANEKKQRMIAAQTAYQASILHNASGQSAGRRVHEGRPYDWTVGDHRVCVAYEVLRVAEYKCVAL